MKILKIIIGVFCFLLTYNSFKNGIPSYSNLAHYAEFIPILIVFIIGILLFKSAFKPEENKNVTLVSKKNENSYNIGEIEKKLKILNEAYNDGIINESEFEEKKANFLLLKNSALSKNEHTSQFRLNKEKLTKLFENEIISKDEFNEKIIQLKEKYEVDEFNFESINDKSKVYYISQGDEHGPVTIGRIAYLLENKKINQNCFIRFENENSYNRRVYEIIKC